MLLRFSTFRYSRARMWGKVWGRMRDGGRHGQADGNGGEGGARARPLCGWGWSHADRRRQWRPAVDVAATGERKASQLRPWLRQGRVAGGSAGGRGGAPQAGPRRHAALPYTEVPAFLSKLRKRGSVVRLALEAALLTAARSGEVRGATWSELDLDAATWTIPAERMKAGKPHVVPLSASALDVF